MLSPKDFSYIETKDVMLGKKKIRNEFVKLANWISETYKVKVINIVYDLLYNNTLPRLNICFEFESELERFKDDNSIAYLVEYQKAIGSKFKELLESEGSKEYQTENILVVFSAFKPIAIMEIFENIPENRISEFQNELEDNSIWKIEARFYSVIFFLYTDKQVAENKQSRIGKLWAEKTFKFLEPYDEFKYLNIKDFNIFLDSKENFEKKYGSNWSNYYRR